MIRTKRKPGPPLQLTALLLALAMNGLALSVIAQEDELAKELPRIKPLSPAAAMESFRIHDGFRLAPVAVEPMVADPVSVCYDAHGRLYVVEMRGYPYPEKTPTGQVTRLEDRDGDGRFETRTVFLEGARNPLRQGHERGWRGRFSERGIHGLWH
jgi:hypothetical protein